MRRYPAGGNRRVSLVIVLCIWVVLTEVGIKNDASEAAVVYVSNVGSIMY